MRRLLEKHPDGIDGFIEAGEIIPGADKVG